MIEDSKTFCMFPWIHLSVQPDKEVLPCCNASSLGLYYEETSLNELWNSKEIKNLRVNMLNGVESSTCEYCYVTERVGQKSPRQIINEKYNHHLNIVKSTKNDGEVDKLNLVYWDFRFSNICNFKCRMCGPISSTSWYEDYRKLTGKNHNSGKTSNINVLDELDPLFDIVEEIYFAGGEPLILDEHYYILNKLIELNKTNIPIVYSTNLSILKYKDNNILDIWKNFEDISLGISLDGSGKRGELIRNGMKWNTFLENLTTVKRNVPKVKCLIAFTTQALNCFDMMNTQKLLFDFGLLNSVDDFIFQFLETPEILSMQILDNNTKKILCNKIEDHIQNFLIPSGSVKSLSDYKSMIEYLNLEDKSYLIPQFIKYCSSLDFFRNEDTEKTFPELKNLWIGQ